MSHRGRREPQGAHPVCFLLSSLVQQETGCKDSWEIILTDCSPICRIPRFYSAECEGIEGIIFAFQDPILLILSPHARARAHTHAHTYSLIHWAPGGKGCLHLIIHWQLSYLTCAFWLSTWLWKGLKASLKMVVDYFISEVLLRSTAVAVNCENVKLLDSLSPAWLASLTGPVSALTIRIVSIRNEKELCLNPNNW